MVLSLTPFTNLPRLVSNKKNYNEMSESVDERLQTEKTLLKLIAITKQN